MFLTRSKRRPWWRLMKRSWGRRQRGVSKELQKNLGKEVDKIRNLYQLGPELKDEWIKSSRPQKTFHRMYGITPTKLWSQPASQLLQTEYISCITFKKSHSNIIDRVKDMMKLINLTPELIQIFNKMKKMVKLVNHVSELTPMLDKVKEVVKLPSSSEAIVKQWLIFFFFRKYREKN
jgi:hypothetical protein